jgi:hypothetical protein
VAGGEDLGDGPAGVIGHEIDAGEPERVAEVLQTRRQRRNGQILPGRHRALAVQRQVERDAASLPGQRADDIAPEERVRGDAVHEQGHRPGSLRGLRALRGLPVLRALRGLRVDVDVADLA